jgi:hypothetical protein
MLNVDEKKKKQNSTVSSLISTDGSDNLSITLHEVQKALYLLNRFNPGYLELICIPSESYVFITPEWRQIIEIHSKTLRADRTVFSFSNLILAYHKKLEKAFKKYFEENTPWEEITGTVSISDERVQDLRRLYRWLDFMSLLLGKPMKIEDLTELSKKMRGSVRFDAKDEEVDKAADKLLLSIRRSQLTKLS